MSGSSGATLTYKELKALVAGDAVAIRGAAELEAPGGRLDKVFPPSHMVDKYPSEPGAKYATEDRTLNGVKVLCVLLDSVQSQANRMELALQGLWEQGKLRLPVVVTDFRECAPDVGIVSSLTAPHRIADAILRDSLLDGKLFRSTDIGKSFTDASVRNAAPLFKVCPTGLVFGIWDSTGPRGGLGAKFARALVSEIVGVDVRCGVKTSSRIDPCGIVTKAADIYQAQDASEVWTVDESLAKKDNKQKPIRLGEGRPAEVNHSNIPPSQDHLAGGITMDHALHFVTLSLAGLRKLSFGGRGKDDEARTVLAALGLLAILESDRQGYDLRSRCLLVPRPGKALHLGAVDRSGVERPIVLTAESALPLYTEAVAALPPDLRFATEPGKPLAALTPSPKLKRLVERSRELAATQDEDAI